MIAKSYYKSQTKAKLMAYAKKNGILIKPDNKQDKADRVTAPTDKNGKGRAT